MDKRTKMMQLAQQWKESGLSRPVFARQQGITIHSLEYWCRKQKEEQVNQPVAPSFLELVRASSSSPVKRQVK